MEYVTPSWVGSEVVSWRRERVRVRVKKKKREGMVFSCERERERERFVEKWDLKFGGSYVRFGS